jgi:hypothetical protein
MLGQTCQAKVTRTRPGARRSLVNPGEIERSDMSGLGAGHVRLGFLESD